MSRSALINSCKFASLSLKNKYNPILCYKQNIRLKSISRNFLPINKFKVLRRYPTDDLQLAKILLICLTFAAVTSFWHFLCCPSSCRNSEYLFAKLQTQTGSVFHIIIMLQVYGGLENYLPSGVGMMILNNGHVTHNIPYAILILGRNCGAIRAMVGVRCSSGSTRYPVSRSCACLSGYERIGYQSSFSLSCQSSGSWSSPSNGYYARCTSRSNYILLHS